MVEVQDASTLTDVCISDQLPEVELISLVSEALPLYRLRADTITDFTAYHHQDWGIQQPPLVCAHDLQLSNEQIQEVFKYFLICGKRVSQMTKVYDDIGAVTHLLEEKERDLELAARIGQTLLEQNKQLVAKCEQLELELVSYQEQTAQLKHDLSQKEQLLQLLTTEEQSDSRQPSPPKESSTSKYIEVVQKKLSSLEDENSLLKSEVESLATQTLEVEEHEQRLTSDCIRQLNEAQVRLRELQAETEKKGVELIKCQEECSSVIQQLVRGQQKMKELTIENLDMKESLKTTNEVQQELASELFELREKYKECRDLLDCTKHEVSQLKLMSSPRVATNRYYTGPCYIPPEGSLAAELESLNSGERDLNRKTNSKVLETAQYVRKLSSKPSSLTSSISSNSGRVHKPTAKNLLLSAPIPGSPITRSSTNQMSASITGSVSQTPKSRTHSTGPSAQFFDEIERHRLNLGRPGIPGSKDLDKALNRLTLRRQNEKSEQDYKERERHASEQSHQSTISAQSMQQEMDWSEASTPTVRSPSPESELSGYGSASSFGYRMPEKLQIVKPMEGSATLHHWQRLATPHMAGIFEQRDGVQIKHEKPLNDLESATYSLLDVEEEVVPVRPSGRTLFTNTVTDARVLHPSMTSYSVQSAASISSATAMTSGSNSRYGSGIISRLHSSVQPGLTGLVEEPSASVRPSHVNVVTKNRVSAIVTPQAMGAVANTNNVLNFKSSGPPRSSLIDFSSHSFGTPTKTAAVMTSYSQQTKAKAVSKPEPIASAPVAESQSFGILSNFYKYMLPAPATTTTPSGLSSVVSDAMFGGTSQATRGVYGRWQKPL